MAKPVPYTEALQWQYEQVRRRQEGATGDTLLLLEHTPVITLGRRESGANLLSSPDDLRAQGIDVQTVDRGGEATYHAPGQLVGYPILDLRNHGQDLHRYLRDLEQVVIDTLARFGLAGERESGLTGVWVAGRKVAALGIKVSRWVSMHGFALNVDVDLAPMRRDIVPCGLHGRDVCSLAELLPKQHMTRSDVEPVLVQTFAEVFGMRMVPGVYISLCGYNRGVKVHVKMEVAGRHVDETVSGPTAEDILIQVKARVAQEMGWKGLIVQAMSPLQFAQEGVRRFNASTKSEYALPRSADEFLELGTDLGYLTLLPDES